jgi:Ca2+-binding RTX toxin-like protein
MEGGLGNDTYVIGNPNDQLVEQGNGGVDEVRSEWSYTLGANLENLVLTGERSVAGTGNELDNEITGNSGRNVLTGALGADTLMGGAGADLFVYTSIDESGAAPGTWDILLDFSTAERDQIDLAQIDADPASPGKQGFSFIGDAAFSSTNATGQLRFDPATHMLYASIDADTDAEMAIQVTGVSSLGAQDFNL